MTQDDLDDENIAVPLASMFQFFGSYHTAYVSSNSYITFSYGSDAFNGLSASYPSGKHTTANCLLFVIQNSKDSC